MKLWTTRGKRLSCSSRPASIVSVADDILRYNWQQTMDCHSSILPKIDLSRDSKSHPKSLMPVD